MMMMVMVMVIMEICHERSNRRKQVLLELNSCSSDNTLSLSSHISRVIKLK